MLEALADRLDPIAQVEAAHETAAALLHIGHAEADPEVTRRLIELVDEMGFVVLADLWATRPARSLPGALWKLYLLREWVVSDPEGIARDYAEGSRLAEPHHVVAGVDWPQPHEIRQVADEILRGAFTGDFAVALERAAAFCHVVSAGRHDRAGAAPAPLAGDQLLTFISDLVACAALWRAGKLD